MMLADATGTKIMLFQWLLPLLVALVVIGVTVELVRRRKLRDEYALLWIGASSVLLVFAVYPRLLLIISEWLGVYYLTTLFFMGFGFLCLIILHLSTDLSRMAGKQCRMIQTIGLLENRIHQLESEKTALKQGDSEDSARGKVKT